MCASQEQTNECHPLICCFSSVPTSLLYLCSCSSLCLSVSVEVSCVRNIYMTRRRNMPNDQMTKHLFLERGHYYIFLQILVSILSAAIINRSKCVPALVWVSACQKCVVVCVLHTLLLCCFVFVSVRDKCLGKIISSRRIIHTIDGFWLLIFTVHNICFAVFLCIRVCLRSVCVLLSSRYT